MANFFFYHEFSTTFIWLPSFKLEMFVVWVHESAQTCQFWGKHLKIETRMTLKLPVNVVKYFPGADSLTCASTTSVDTSWNYSLWAHTRPFNKPSATLNHCRQSWRNSTEVNDDSFQCDTTWQYLFATVGFVLSSVVGQNSLSRSTLRLLIKTQMLGNTSFITYLIHFC